MAIGETAKLVASLQLDTKKFDSGVAKANKSLGLLGHTASTALGVGIANIATKGLSLLGGAIEAGIQGALTLEKAQAQTAAVIQSTGAAAGVTADQVRDLAQSTEDLTTVDDKTIQQAENLLLTFTNIGSTVFPAATKAVTDMAVAMNKGDASTADLDSAAIQLGKALNDPVKGLTALSKVGVSFSAQQADQIKRLAGTGNALKDLKEQHVALTKEQAKYIKDLGGSVGPLTAARKAGVKLTAQQAAMLKKMEDGSGTIEAQKIILAELEKEFGNAGKAAGTGFAADMTRAQDAIQDAQVSIAQGLLPAVGEVAVELKRTLDDPTVKKGLVDLGKGLGSAIKAAVAFAKTVPWGAIATSLQAAAGFAKDLLNAFLGLPTWVQTAVITGWGLNKLTGGALSGIVGSLASGLIKGVLGINAGIVNVNAATVAGAGGLPGAAGQAAGAAAGLSIGAVILGVGAAAALGGAAGGAIATAVTHIIDPTGLAAAQAGQSLGNRDPRRFDANGRVIANTLGEIAKNTSGSEQDIEKLRGLISEGLHPADIEALRGGIESQLQSNSLDDAVRAANVVAATDLSGQKTSAAATIAGFNAANASRSAGHEVAAAVAANRPITNVTVEISATNVDRVNVVEDRGGERSGSRNGDGAGFGPAGR